MGWGGGQEGGSRSRGHHIPTADSCCYTEKPTQHCKAIIRQLKANLNKRIKETPWSSLTPSTTRRHGEKLAIHVPGRGPSPYTESATVLTLDFPASRTTRSKCCFNNAHPFFQSICGAATGVKTHRPPRRSEESGNRNRHSPGDAPATSPARLQEA